MKDNKPFLQCLISRSVTPLTFKRCIPSLAVVFVIGGSCLSLIANAATEPKAAEPNPPVVSAKEDSAKEDSAKEEPTPKQAAKEPANEEANRQEVADAPQEKAPNEAPAPPLATAIFDGTTLNGWRGYQAESPAGWSVADGVMAFSGTGDDIITVEQYQNFELTLEFKTVANTNSGVVYRIRMGDKAPYMSGPEYQIHTPPDGKPGNLLHATGALYALYPTQAGLEKPIGEWNTAKLVIKGERIEHWLNETKVVDCDMNSDAFKEKLKKSKFNGWPQFNQTKKGHLGLQSHGHPVWFRNVKVRELP